MGAEVCHTATKILGLTCKIDFVCAHMDKDAEEMLLLYDIPPSRRAAHALQMLYLI